MPKLLVCLLLVCSSLSAHAASAKIIKVLPLLLDKEGRHALSPSLYDRDAYQVRLRRRPEDRGGLRFAVQWKSHDAAPLKLRIEMLGALGPEPTRASLEASVQHRGWFSNWAALNLTGEDYKKFGELLAWRATLWKGNVQVGEQKSFLWTSGK